MSAQLFTMRLKPGQASELPRRLEAHGARARASDLQRRTGLTTVRATMAEILEGAPELVDLNVVAEVS